MAIGLAVQPTSTAPRFALIPDSTGYTVQQGNEVVWSPLPGGPSSSRRDVIGAPDTVTLQWTCTPDAYNYAEAFFRSTIANGSQPLHVQLTLDGAELEWYQCKFVPGTFGLTKQQGATYVLGGTLEVTPLISDTEYDTSVVTMYGIYGEGSAAFLDLLEEFVNVDFPPVFA